jgi:hypothetical protein
MSDEARLIEKQLNLCGYAAVRVLAAHSHVPLGRGAGSYYDSQPVSTGLLRRLKAKEKRTLKRPLKIYRNITTP